MENEQQSARSWITDGIMIASITSLAYLFSFTYESGYCKSFKIPLDFISLSLTTILVAAEGLFIIITSVILLLNFLIIAGIFDFSNPVMVAFSRTAIVLLFLIANILLYEKMWR